MNAELREMREMQEEARSEQRMVQSRLASAAEALEELAYAYERTGAAALARETRCIVQVMTARNSVLSGGGATLNAKLSDAP